MLGDRIEKLFPFLFLGERDADPLLDSLHGERCVCEDRLPVGLPAPEHGRTFLPVHRPFPWPGQEVWKGSERRGSPKGTIGSEKRASTCRTFFTIPRGENNTTPGDSRARAGRESSRHSGRTENRKRAFRFIGSSPDPDPSFGQLSKIYGEKGISNLGSLKIPSRRHHGISGRKRTPGSGMV